MLGVELLEVLRVVGRLRVPSACGQSEPKSTRSAPIRAVSPAMSSSGNGDTQKWRRKISDGRSSTVSPNALDVAVEQAAGVVERVQAVGHPRRSRARC